MFDNVLFQNCSCTFLERHLEILRGSGSQTPFFLKERLSGIYREEGAQTKKKTPCYRGIDIFWKGTLGLLKVHSDKNQMH